MGAWHCRDCDADWAEDPKRDCPCGGGHRTMYAWNRKPMDQSEANEAAFQAYYARYALSQLEAEIKQIESV